MVTEALEGTLSAVGNRADSANAKGCLTARLTGRAGAKAGVSDPAVPAWNGRRLTDKSYLGDNRLIRSKSSLRRPGLAPRCRLIASWGGNTSQGSGCSPVKAVRELGSKRRETVWSLSVAGVGGREGGPPQYARTGGNAATVSRSGRQPRRRAAARGTDKR